MQFVCDWYALLIFNQFLKATGVATSFQNLNGERVSTQQYRSIMGIFSTRPALLVLACSMSFDESVVKRLMLIILKHTHKIDQSSEKNVYI